MRKDPFDTPFFRDPEGYMARRRRLIIILIVLVVIGYGAFFINAKSQGKPVYTIELVTFGGVHYYQSDSIISQNANSIRFIDMFGREQMVTGENIIVTTY